MNVPKVPKVAQLFLTWFCKDQWTDELLGDLDEAYKDNYYEKGRLKALLIYYKEVLLLIRPHIIKRRKTQISHIMFKSYIKSAYRSLLRSKIYSTINILGLSVGIACCLLISLYVHDEISYDEFFKDSERIYRVALERKYPNNTRYFGSSPVNLAPVLKENFPEVEEAGRLHRLFFQNQRIVSIGEKSFIEEKYLFADEDFFKVASFEFIEGDPNTALDHPNQTVITKSVARKYFGNQSALNKTYRIDTVEYVISGVIEDVPANSHLDFDLLGSIHSLPFLERAADTNNWISPWLYTYIKLKEGVDPNEFQAKFGDVVRTYGLASILSQLGMSELDYADSGHEFNYFLQPIEDIHLKSHLDVEVQPNSDILYVYMLSAVVVFILIISCINFINLATARSTERAKEVGVRKVMGSNRSSLVKQFLTESNLISFGAMFIALLAVWFSLPYFNQLISKELVITTLTAPPVIAALIGFAFLVGSLAGLYPALVISSINSAQVLKGRYKTSGKGVGLRNFLIVFQFFISITMISGTLLLNKQINYMRNKQLGFSKENLLVIEQAGVLGQQGEVFRNEIIQMDGVSGVGSGFAMPGDFIGNLIVNSEDPQVPQVRTFTNTIDENYVPTLGMEIIAGRNFSLDFNDSLNILVNETAMELLGYDDPIGRKVINPSPQPNQPTDFTIIGVVKDYHQQSLHTDIPPMLLFRSQSQFFLPNIAIKISSDNTLEVLKKIESKWNELVDERPISYSFLEESLQNLYQSDRQNNKIFSLFTMVAIILACVGLFGLAAFITQQRTKEIGIRKVLGASVSSIILLLSKDFTKLILLAFVASMPLVYFGMIKWFENFAYRTSIDVLTLAGAGFLTLAMAWLTIGYYSIKIAFLNPVNSLKSE